MKKILQVRILFLSLILLSCYEVSSQETTIRPNEINSFPDQENTFTELSPLNFNLALQTGFQVIPGDNKGVFFQSINPEIEHTLSQNISIFAGVQQTWIQNLNHFSRTQEGELSMAKTNASYSLFYAGGSYQVNPRLRLSGVAWKQFDQKSILEKKPLAPNFDAKGFQLYMNYRISDKVHINASFNYEQGSNLLFNSFHQPYSPFGVSPVLNNNHGFFYPY
jgi:long-subunit fatty acid transport protein